MTELNADHVNEQTCCIWYLYQSCTLAILKYRF